MPLPETPFTFHGGCNCRSIRYRADIPELSARPRNGYLKSEKFPMISTDHCNDCRRATGAPLPIWIDVPAEFLSVSTLKPSSYPSDPHFSSDRGAEKPSESDPRRTPFLPAMDFFRPGSKKDLGTAHIYESSERTFRIFCSRCGTYLMYMKYPMPEGWPDMFDVLMGSIDCEDLNHEYMRPTHQAWWSCGVDWIQDFSRGNARDTPRHPGSDFSKVVED